jgi:hypothetical protein
MPETRYRTALAPAALAALLLLSTGPVSAQIMCSRPVSPICATDVVSTNDTADGAARQRCIEDTSRFVDGLDEYRRCIADAVAGAETDLKAAEDFLACLRSDDRQDCAMAQRN